MSSVKRLKESLQAEAPSKTNSVKSIAEGWDAETGEPDKQPGAMRMVQGLGLCIGLFLVGVAIAKRINPKLAVVNEQRMCVRSRLPLTSKTQLVLAEVDGQEVLIAVGQEHVSLMQSASVKPIMLREPVLVDGGKETPCKEELQRTA
jgi:flagellar biogenesis protein FliO